MSFDSLKNSSPDSNNVTKTGYRALFLLIQLLESPKSRAELMECFSNDPVINKELAKDTVTISVNTLKKAGCVISRPSQRTKNKYVLKSHPFSIRMTQEQIQDFQALRESLISLNDWELLLYLNNLYAKFSFFAPDEESKEMLLYNHPLAKVNFDALSQLNIAAKLKSYVSICYDSPENGLEDLDFLPQEIRLENEKLYVWGFNKKYNEVAYLQAERIKKYNHTIFLKDEKELLGLEKPALYVEYELKGYSALMYQEGKAEKLIKEDKTKEYSVKIGAEVTNKFNFMQRILHYGTDCRIISPDSFRQEVLDTLRKIKAEYKDVR